MKSDFLTRMAIQALRIEHIQLIITGGRAVADLWDAAREGMIIPVRMSRGERGVEGSVNRTRLVHLS